MKRFNVLGFVSVDPLFDLWLFFDEHAVARLKDDLLETFKGEISFDPCGFQHDSAAGVGDNLTQTRI